MAERFTNLNLKNTGATTLYTPPNGGGAFFVVRDVFIFCRAAVSITVPASISIGTNSSNFDNILPITPLTGLLSAGLIIRLTPTLSVTASKNIPIKINVTSAATGTTQVVD